MGGTYCYAGPDSENQKANEKEGKCSCDCPELDYYDATWGLNYLAQYYKNGL